MTKSRVLPISGMILVVILWGLSFLSIKVAVNVLGPMTLALSRFTIASVLLIAFLKLREPKSKLNIKDAPLMVLSGIIGITIYFFFENNGVKMTTASTASIIIGAIPVLTIISDFLFFGNKITWYKGLGVILSFLGVILIVGGNSHLRGNTNYFRGNLFMFGAALSWVAYSLSTRPLGKKYSRLAITTYQTLFATLATVPFALLETNKWAGVNATVLVNVVFLGVFCSALGYYCYVFAIGELGVDVTTLFINLIPVVTVISSYFILGEKITHTQLIGGAIIIAAVYLADLNSWFKFRDLIKHCDEKDNSIQN